MTISQKRSFTISQMYQIILEQLYLIYVIRFGHTLLTTIILPWSKLGITINPEQDLVAFRNVADNLFARAQKAVDEHRETPFAFLSFFSP